MFKRSNNGLSNQALFHDVDIVAYVEGTSKPSGLGNSFDERFWTTIFHRLMPEIRITFKPGGSKTNLEIIAKSVVREEVENTFVCMDADYEHFYGLKFGHPFVFYTYGYSWENDLALERNLSGVLDLFCYISPSLEQETDLMHLASELNLIGAKIGCADVVLQREGLPIQNKKKPGELLQMDGAELRFSRNKIVAKAKDIRSKRTKKKIISIISYCFWRDYHGKTIYFALYNMAKLFAMEHGGALKISNEFVLVRLLRWFEHDNDENKWAYYKTMCDRVAL